MLQNLQLSIFLLQLSLGLLEDVGLFFHFKVELILLLLVGDLGGLDLFISILALGNDLCVLELVLRYLSHVLFFFSLKHIQLNFQVLDFFVLHLNFLLRRISLSDAVRTALLLRGCQLVLKCRI